MPVAEAVALVAGLHDNVVQEIVSWRGFQTDAPTGLALDVRLGRFAQQRANEVQSGSQWGICAVPDGSPTKRANGPGFACGARHVTEIIAYGSPNQFNLAKAICAERAAAAALKDAKARLWAVGIGGGSETAFVVVLVAEPGDRPDPQHTFNPIVSLFTGDRASMNDQAPERIVVEVNE